MATGKIFLFLRSFCARISRVDKHINPLCAMCITNLQRACLHQYPLLP